MGLRRAAPRQAAANAPLFPAQAVQAPAGDAGLVPAEDVLLLAIAFPPMTPAQRQLAARFAIEDRISCPVEAVHVTVGAPLGDGRWLVAVMDRARADALASATRAMVPEVLTLPLPEAGQWSVAEQAGRILLRAADGTGLAVRAENFAPLHALAGAPGVVSYGGTLPEGVTPAVTRALPAPNGDFGIDLRPARSGGFAPRLVWQICAVVVAAGFAHLGLLMADGAVLAERAGAREAALRAALTAAGFPGKGDPLTEFAQAAKSGERMDEAAFVPTMAAVFAVLEPFSGIVFLRELQFDAAKASLIIAVESADLDGLQSVSAALSDAGLSVEAGAATAADGLAEQQLTLRGVGR